jgi:hypothetical protein
MIVYIRLNVLNPREASLPSDRQFFQRRHLAQPMPDERKEKDSDKAAVVSEP